MGEKQPREPIRTLKEWREFISKRGSSGEMVFDILDDWEIHFESLCAIAQDMMNSLKQAIKEEDTHRARRGD